jgi:hypothetical protein
MLSLFFMCGFRYEKETAIRISTDSTTTKLKDENDRLRKERNIAKCHVARITREKEELEQQEIDAAKDRLARKFLFWQIILIMPYIGLYLSFGKHIFSS